MIPLERQQVQHDSNSTNHARRTDVISNMTEPAPIIHEGRRSQTKAIDYTSGPAVSLAKRKTGNVEGVEIGKTESPPIRPIQSYDPIHIGIAQRIRLFYYYLQRHIPVILPPSPAGGGRGNLVSLRSFDIMRNSSEPTIIKSHKPI